MDISIKPDLPFRNGFLKVLGRAIAGTLPFFLVFQAIRFYKGYEGTEPLFIGFVRYVREDFLFLSGITLFAVLLVVWDSYNKIKKIEEIETEIESGNVTITYRNLLSRKTKRESIKKRQLRFNLNKKKCKAEISHKLTEPFLLNSSTGFSLGKLQELEMLIAKDDNKAP
ncbi:hypothetical protein [Rufibacter sp. LB8]|uniref:hypothetical protein n=1 Tax=Rufibacter sp. LB8 TaxID=2777781 RepID=UPI00178C2C27|nr:hypothetical protein [Rufibacter sp. LB8]